MTRPVRLVLMPGNDVLVDARVMKNLRTAAELGYDAIGLGICRGEAVREEVFDWGGRVVVWPVSSRIESWRRYRPGRFFFDRTSRSTGRAYAAFLRSELGFVAGREKRDGSRAASTGPGRVDSGGWGRLIGLGRRIHVILVRLWVKARSLRADAELRHEGWQPGRLEAWRQRRFWWLRVTPWRARWRSAVPEAIDRAIVLGGVLDELAPDIVHVHDVYMMHVAAYYAARVAETGRKVRLIYDAREFVPGLAHVPPKRVEAYARLEAEFMRDFDRVVSVSEPMARAVAKRHRLRRFPDIVMNAPMRDDVADDVPSVRLAAGVQEGVPLVVYSGVVNPARGVGTVLEALALLDGVHLAVVANNRGPAVLALIERARRLGLSDRLRFVPFVPHDQVTRYLADADVGICPLSHTLNHDLTVTNKFCEYLEAGLPVVTSDTPAQADLVEELAVGGVFKADDVADCARVLGEVLDKRAELSKRIIGDGELQYRFGWAAQSEVLAHVYAEEALALGLTPPAPLP
ncbi:MAG: glycosyltransferase family 4 protein [Bifidobacteriaceae bacterium]|jgi:glycosyltransferase involved in cell wall biosynthesis|nr:glycosyltransferase family 4 protein [Bifidobacteriaceae bacterium]